MRAAIRPDALLFGETQGRVVISCARQHVELLEMLAQRRGVPCAVIGTAGGRRLELRPWIDEAIDVVSDTWRCGLTSREPRAASAGS
jgi:phosphoribosylformylglycinamidine synthase